MSTSLELEHHGIKGMKWGVRRTPEQLGHTRETELDRYKAKETKKLSRTYASRKRNAAIINRFGLSKEDLSKTKNRLDRQYVKELKKVLSMSYDEMTEEKSAVGRAQLNAALKNAGYVAVAVLTPFPSYLEVFSSSKLKTQRRLNSK